jgi:glycosyltransferase involved in cell wall biosynthesis
VKIAFDPFIFAMQQHGGVSRVHARLAAGMVAVGHDARILAPLHTNAYLPDLPAGILRGRRLPLSREKSRVARMVSEWLLAPQLAAFRPDVVQDSFYSPVVRPPRGARLVVMVHDMIHELFPEHFPAGDRTAARKAAAIARADHILCNSESTRVDMLAHYPEVAGKTSVTLLAVDQPQQPVVRNAPARPFLLYVGQRGGYKNFAALLAAFAASPLLHDSHDLLAVGGGPFSAGEQEAIAGHGLSGKVRQRGADDAQLRQLYADAALFVFPSLYEGFGIPPLEAMTVGTASVAVRASSMPEVCGDGAAYAESGHPDALRAAMEQLLLSPTRQADLVAAGYRRLAQFDWRRCTRDVLAVYERLL